jgi:hypothetical protein
VLRTSIALLGVMMALATPVAAQSQRITGVRLNAVRGEGADQCPNVDGLADDVRQILRHDPFVGPARQWVEVLMTHTTRWQANIVVRDVVGGSLGTRAFDDASSETCDEFSVAVAAAVAVLIEGHGSTHHGPPGVVSLTVRALGAVGLLPAIAPGVGLRAEGPFFNRAAGFWRRFHWLVGIEFFPSAATRARDLTLEVGYTGVELGVCYDLLRRNHMALGTCVSLAGGAVTSAVVEGGTAATSTRPYLTTRAGLNARVPIGPLAIEAGGHWLRSSCQHCGL